MPTHNDIQQRVLAFIKKPEPASFGTLAQEVFSYQYHQNRAYKNYCNSLGKTPESVARWQDIPTVPTDAFKFSHAPLATFAQEKASFSFLTSGTTQEIRGTHHFLSADLYNTSILSAWHGLNIPRLHRAIFLTPKPEDVPHSSLSHMMGVLASEIAKETYWVADKNNNLDVHQLKQALETDEPVAVLGTALAFLLWFEKHPHQYNLAKGSWALETGGYKGSQRSMSKADLYDLFSQHLSLAPDSVINEYSMTELSSQFYAQGIHGRHLIQPWTRVRVMDPATGDEATPGTPGYLHIYDLANTYSVLAIQTQDIAIAHDTESFTLLGRDPSALPRGCSRSSDAVTQSP